MIGRVYLGQALRGWVAPRRTLRGQVAASRPRVIGVWAGLALLLLVGSRLSDTFFTQRNLLNIVDHSVDLGIAALGQTFALLAGSIDLSIGAVISLVSVLASTTMNGNDSLIWPAVALCLGAGVAVGAANALLITWCGVPPFMATLGVMLVVQGLTFSITMDVTGQVSPSFGNLAYGAWFGGVHYAVFLWLGLALLSYLVLTYTIFGQRVYAVGGSAGVARLSGIRTNRVMIYVHIVSAVAAATAGLILASKLSAGDPLVGNGKELDTIAAAVIGGANLMGGKGSIIGTVGGVLLLSTISNLFNEMNVNAFWQDVVKGLIIIGAVALYSARQREVAM